MNMSQRAVFALVASVAAAAASPLATVDKAHGSRGLREAHECREQRRAHGVKEAIYYRTVAGIMYTDTPKVAHEYKCYIFRGLLGLKSWAK